MLVINDGEGISVGYGGCCCVNIGPLVMVGMLCVSIGQWVGGRRVVRVVILLLYYNGCLFS